MVYVTQPPPPPPPPASEPTEISVEDRRLAGAMYFGGGIALLVGAFMPWITVRTLFGSVSATGMERGPGGFVLVVGLGLCGVGLDLLVRSRADYSRVQLIGHRIISAGAAGYAWFTVQPSFDEAAAEGLAVSYGVGLWVLTVGVFIAWSAAARVQTT